MILMSNSGLPIIHIEQIQGGHKGQFVNSETQRILSRLMSIPLQSIQDECNRVANSRREKWKNKDQNAMMIEEGLTNIPYKQGIRELDPSFLLTAPLNIHAQILDFHLDALYPQQSANREAAAGVPSGGDPMNPKLMIFLPTLEVKNSSITWKHKPGTSFGSVIVHEFLHLYGDTPELRPGVVDGVIRHTDVGTEAIRNLIGDF